MTEESFAAAMIQKGYSEHSGEIAALMGWFFLRHLGRLYREFDGDLVLAIVLGEIAHHNICHFFLHGKSLPGKGRPDLTASRIQTELAPCNAFSLSASTEIPRETIRRKIAILIEKGWVEKHAKGGYVILPGVMDSFEKDFNLQTLLDFMTTSDALRRFFIEGNTP